MIELLLAIAIICLALLGLAVGLILKGRPLQTSCDAAACIGGGQCAICPRRHEKKASGHE